MESSFRPDYRKAIFYLSLLSFLLLPLTGCKKNDKKYHIGVSQCSDDEWRRQMNDEINREILFHEEADVEIRSANDDSQRQKEDIEYFLARNFDLIIVAPNEAKALTPVIREAYATGTPIIVFDRNINDSTYTSYIDLDNKAIGEAAGRYAIEAHRQKGGKILELAGLRGSTPAEERHQGFMKVLNEDYQGEPPLSYYADWNDAPAYRLTDSLLHTDPDIRVIYAHNDVMAIAAAGAASDNNRRDITVIGTDGAPGLGVKAVADSLIEATFSYPTVGEEAIKLAMSILNGDSVEKVTRGPATTLIDQKNAPVFLSLNELLKQKTLRISDLNKKYFILNDRRQSERALLYATVIASIFLIAIIFGLLYFVRQKSRLQKQLSDKNTLLTQQQKTQEELYAKLEEATRSKLAFFTNVSHDLRTPLALIADPVEKIAAKSYLPAQDRSIMKIVVRNVKILRRMIDQILDFRRYENGNTRLSLHTIPILEFVRTWGADFENYADQHNIRFSLNIDNLSGFDNPSMITDVEKLERVIFNLISNALKYTSEGGKVDVDVKIEPTLFSLTVSDTGMGIKEEEIDKIFDRFYQVDSPRPKGSGIGLSLTKAFVEMLGGKIEARSIYGKGSSFFIAIPAAVSEEKGESGLASGKFDFELIDTPEHEEETLYALPSTITDTMRNEGKQEEERPILLIIDDNDDIRSLVGMMMGDKYNVVEAANGREGLRLAIKFIPDVIVCDIMMPDMDGLEVTRRLKDDRITSHIPVLILTACRLDEHRVRSYDSGADAFLSKPFTEVLLKSRCASLIANRRRIFDLFLEDNAGIAAEMAAGRKGVKDHKATLPARELSSREQRLSLENDFYRDFMNIISDSYYKETLTITEIAERLGIGVHQLTRKVKAIANATPVEILRGFRLRKARAKLIATDATVAEIAYSTGFSSSQYFSRCFREAYNMSPSEMRNSVKNNK